MGSTQKQLPLGGVCWRSSCVSAVSGPFQAQPHAGGQAPQDPLTGTPRRPGEPLELACPTSSPCGYRWALWGAENGKCRPRACGGPGWEDTLLGGHPCRLTKAQTLSDCWQPCSERLTAKLLLVSLCSASAKEKSLGLEAEGHGLGPFKGLGVQDGRAVAEAGTEVGPEACL